GVDIDHEQHDIGGIESPGSTEEARRRDNVAALYRHPAVDHGDTITHHEYEEISSTAEAEVSQRQQVDDVVRDMVDEDRPVGDTERQIQPRVALEGGEVCLDGRFHRKK